jgi:ABC-2 type transport system permease protein
VPASAALFAIVHPPLAAPAVFLLGVSAAAVRERTGRIAAAMAAHTAYNAVIAAATLLDW